MELEYNGVKITVDIMGEFKVEENEYAVCSYEDDQDNHKIVIVQVEKADEKYIAKDIPDEEVDKVMETYEAIKAKLDEI